MYQRGKHPQEIENLFQPYIELGIKQPPESMLHELREQVLQADGLRSARDHSLYGQVCLELAMTVSDDSERSQLFESSERCLTEAVSEAGTRELTSATALLAHLPKYKAHFLEGREPAMEEERQVLSSMRELALHTPMYTSLSVRGMPAWRHEVACHAIMSRANLRSGELQISSWPALDRQRQRGWTLSVSQCGFLDEPYIKLNTSGQQSECGARRAEVVGQRGSDMSVAFLDLLAIETELQAKIADSTANPTDRQSLAERGEQLDGLSRRILKLVGVSNDK